MKVIYDDKSECFTARLEIRGRVFIAEGKTNWQAFLNCIELAKSRIGGIK